MTNDTDQLSRRGFLGLAAATGAAALIPGCEDKKAPQGAQPGTPITQNIISNEQADKIVGQIYPHLKTALAFITYDNLLEKADKILTDERAKMIPEGTSTNDANLTSINQYMIMHTQDEVATQYSAIKNAVAASKENIEKMSDNLTANDQKVWDRLQNKIKGMPREEKEALLKDTVAKLPQIFKNINIVATNSSVPSDKQSYDELPAEQKQFLLELFDKATTAQLDSLDKAIVAKRPGLNK